jgi:hypothetical protein
MARSPDRAARDGTRRNRRHEPTGLITQRSLVQIQPAQQAKVLVEGLKAAPQTEGPSLFVSNLCLNSCFTFLQPCPKRTRLGSLQPAATVGIFSLRERSCDGRQSLSERRIVANNHEQEGDWVILPPSRFATMASRHTGLTGPVAGSYLEAREYVWVVGKVLTYARR